MPFNRVKYNAVLRSITEQEIVVFGPRVLILRDDSEAETKGGLVIPDEAKVRKRKGTIVALGQGYAEAGEDEYVQGITVGYRVTFNAYDGIEHDIDTDEGTVPVVAMHVGNLYLGWKAPEE